MSFEASMEALASDSKAWQAASDTLASAQSSAGGLTIPEYAFSFAGGDVAALYESARSYVEGYLQQGAKETGKAAETLLEIREDFMSTDAGERDRYNGKWEIPK